MLKINLAPQRLKDKFKLERISHLLSMIFFIAGSYLFLLIALLFSADYYMQSHLEQTLGLAKSVTKNTESYTKEIDRINNTINYLTNVQEDHVYWSKLFYHIGLATNKDVKLNSIHIDKKNNIVSMSIHAATREGLLDFKKIIEESEYLKEIDFPIKTLFEKEDIEFSINAKIDSYEFNEL